MQNLMKVMYFVFSPVLVVMYWRNSMKELDNLNAELNFAD